MRVLGSEAVQDPTKVEAHVRAQMAQRQKWVQSAKSTFSQPLKEKCISEVVRIDSIIIFHLISNEKPHSPYCVMCYISGEAAVEIWTSSLLGVKELTKLHTELTQMFLSSILYDYMGTNTTRLWHGFACVGTEKGGAEASGAPRVPNIHMQRKKDSSKTTNHFYISRVSLHSFSAELMKQPMQPGSWRLQPGERKPSANWKRTLLWGCTVRCSECGICTTHRGSSRLTSTPSSTIWQVGTDAFTDRPWGDHGSFAHRWIIFMGWTLRKSPFAVESSIIIELLSWVSWPPNGMYLNGNKSGPLIHLQAS